jgi:Glycosyltransferase family 87
MARLSRLIACRWLDAERARVYAWCFILAYALGYGRIVAPVLAQGGDIDFNGFYAAALGATRDAAAIYDPAALAKLEQEASSGHATVFLTFLYPPMALLYLLPLAVLPYRLAFLVWDAAQLALLVAALRRIAAPTKAGPAAAIVPFFAVTPLLHSLVVGQGGVLTAALIGLGTALLAEGRHFAAGLVLGCLCYKPHLALMLPVAVLAGGQYRAVLGAVLAIVMLAGAAALAFGPGVFTAYLDALPRAGTGAYLSGSAVPNTIASAIPPALLLTPYGAALQAGAPVALAAALQGAVTLAAAIIVWRIWRRREIGMAPKALALIGGTLLASPVIVFYDYAMVAVALAWTWRAARSTGWLGWEKPFYLAISLAGFDGFAIAGLARVPLVPLFAAAILFQAWRRCDYAGSANAMTSFELA